MSLFICPICSSELTRGDKNYVCPKGHCYDIASSGYVNLLPVNKKRSASPGDDKAMAAARKAFLDKGYYRPLRDALCNAAVELAPKDVTLLDAGCGEGYYTAEIYHALEAAEKSPQMAGIDISKDILKYAAKREKRIEYAVASSFHLPIRDSSVDILLNCFSPLAEEEFRRVLKKGGYFIYVVPAAGHLWEMKSIAYDVPYPNEEKDIEYEGFRYADIIEVKSVLQLENQTDISNLFSMTPYFWRTPREGVQRLSQLEKLETAAEFRIHILKKL